MGKNDVFKLTDEEFETLASESADPRITKTAAAFDALLARCLKVPPRSKPMSAETVEFLQELDRNARQFVKDNELGEIRDDN